jgi:predicted RNase H-like HicB family nuclease
LERRKDEQQTPRHREKRRIIACRSAHGELEWRSAGEACGAAFAIYLEVEVPMQYKVALHRSEEGFAASVPGLPGCWSQGATEAEALENIRVAIVEYLSAVDDQLRGEDVRVVEVAA